MDMKSIIPDNVSTPAKIFLFAAVLNGIGNGVFNVVGQLYFTTLGFTSSALASIFMMNAIGAAILTIPMGMLADRYGKKAILLIMTLYTVVGVTALLFTKSVVMFKIGFLSFGASNAAAVILSPLYSSFFEKDDLERAFGLWGALNIVTMSLGSLLGFVPPLLVKNYGFTLARSYWIFLALGSVFFVGQCPFYLTTLRGSTHAPKKGGFKFSLSSKSLVLKYSLLTLISVVSFGVFFGLFPYYVNKKFSIQSDALGSLFFLSNFVAAGAQAVSPRISKKLGATKTMALSIGLATPFYLLIPFAPSFTWISAFYVLRVGFRTLADPLFGSSFMKQLQDDEKSTANSIRMMSMQSGNILGSWLGGQLMERASLDLPAYLGGGLYAILAVLTLVLLGDAKGRVGAYQLPAIKTGLKDPLKGDSRPIPLHPDN
jgi:predicted MFS family arabinose efflux permease